MFPIVPCYRCFYCVESLRVLGDAHRHVQQRGAVQLDVLSQPSRRYNCTRHRSASRKTLWVVSCPFALSFTTILLACLLEVTSPWRAPRHELQSKA
jgi:hypothetical protein